MQPKSVPVTIPLLNPNEPEVRLASLMIREGQSVTKGQVIATLETTKSTSDLIAETSGYVIDLRFVEGDTIPSGEILCYLADSPDWKPPERFSVSEKDTSQGEAYLLQTREIPKGLRITQPALDLANKHGFSLDNLPIGPLVTESLVKSLMETAQKTILAKDDKSDIDPTSIIVYGGGGHGKSIIDLISILGDYQIIGVIDDGLSSSEKVLGYAILGGNEVLPELRDKGIGLAVNAVGGIGNLQTRIKVFELLTRAGFVFPTLIHPTAYIEPSATLSEGVQVLPHAYIGSQAEIGFGVIVNTGAIISHDCQLEDYVNLSPGAILAGEVHIGYSTLIGMGVTINLGVTIGSKTRIGNGATIKSDVPSKSIVRAGSIWPQ